MFRRPGAAAALTLAFALLAADPANAQTDTAAIPEAAAEQGGVIYTQQEEDGAAASAAGPLLDTPRRAMHTFVYWQMKGHARPEFAAATMKLAEGSTLQDRIELSTKLLRVLDAKGLMVVFSRVPEEPAWRDTLSGRHQYIPFIQVPEVYLERVNGEWVFSQATIQAIPGLYRDTFSVFVDIVLDNLPDALRVEVLGVEVWQLLALFTWILLGLVLMKVFDHALNQYVEPVLRRTSSRWDDKVFTEIEKPLDFIFLFGFYRLTYSNLMLPVQANNVLANGFEIAVSVSVVWLLYKLANVASLFLEAITSQTESKLDDQLVPLLRKSLKVFVVAVGVLFILQNNGINVTSLLAGLGIGGLAVALAARDTLANFFGSVTIFVDKPFQIGDWVKVGSLEGTVEEVGFRSTRIRTFYNSVITVPNSKLADSEIDNLGLREYRRFKTSINLTYDTTPEQMEAFVEGVKAIVRSTPSIRQDYYEIHFESLGAHSLDVLVYIFFKVPSWSDELQSRHNFLLDVMRLAREIGVEFAFPTQTLHISSVHQGEHEPAPAKAEGELAGVVESFAPEGTQVRPGGVRIFRDGREVDYSAIKA